MVLLFDKQIIGKMAIINHPIKSEQWCYAMQNREMVVRRDEKALSMEDLTELMGEEALDLFSEPENGITVLALNEKRRDLIMTDAVLSSKYKLNVIREHFYVSNEAEVARAARAKALIGWRQNTQYCGRCGAKLIEHATLTACECPSCKNLIFPRIEPCVITVVSRQDGKILLARHVQRNQDIYACIAGFMEAGETAEQAVAREVMEETGLRIKNICYYGSQSWPFPSQLMLGFTAEYESGDILLQQDELSDARWFDREDCPASPAPGSIAWRLIHLK